MTFSLVAYDEATNSFGSIICSSSPAVAARCAHLADGAGAAHTQNITDPRLGPRLLDLMAAGKPAGDAVEAVIAERPETAAYRQLLAVDMAGRTAVHSGRQALGTVAEHQADGAAAAGNLLADEAVPRRMVEAWHRSAGQPAETRLLAALRAAMAAGGEAGPVHSAGLSVVAGYGWRVTDLRADWSGDPLADLEALLEVWLPQRADYIARALRPQTSPGYGVPGDNR
ncbi:MAG TPA: DUF1028 domain-containing protein [Trebonia sp.]